jgi:hypothetical protein
MSRFKGVTYLTDEQYATLIANGTLTVDGVTINYDQDMLYVTPQAESGGVSKEEFNKLLNNTTYIKPNSKGTIIVGSTAETVTATYAVGIGASVSVENGSVAIGNGADCLSGQTGGVAIGDGSSVGYGVAIGSGASSGNSGTAIGRGAKAPKDKCVAIGGTEVRPAKANGTSGNIQIGSGTNETDYTVQIEGDNIYNYNTHTLTVQNIELNGEDLTTELGKLNTALKTILGV